MYLFSYEVLFHCIYENTYSENPPGGDFNIENFKRESFELYAVVFQLVVRVPYILNLALMIRFASR